jgi:hypothetical protein
MFMRAKRRRRGEGCMDLFTFAQKDCECLLNKVVTFVLGPVLRLQSDKQINTNTLTKKLAKSVAGLPDFS